MVSKLNTMGRQFSLAMMVALLAMTSAAFAGEGCPAKAEAKCDKAASCEGKDKAACKDGKTADARKGCCGEAKKADTAKPEANQKA